MSDINHLPLNSRRYDLDWLRVIAFGILIYFHAAVAFLPDGIPMIINEQPSETLTIGVAFLHQFRLALLFFVSGCGVCFALRSRTRNAFLKERSYRLLIPLLFGITVLVPVMVYFEKRYLGEEFSGFFGFYARYYTSGVYPGGHLSWHHFWFLAYLYLFCLLGWPVFKRLSSDALIQNLVARYRLDSYGIYLLVVPLFVIELFLRPLFPGFRDLIHDWASFSHWFVIFVAGFVFARERRLLEAARQFRFVSLSAAVIATAVLFAAFWQSDPGHLYPFPEGEIDVLRFVAFSLIRVIHAWLWILVCVGFAAQLLNRQSRILSELNRAVYPVFCLHLPVLVVLEYYVLPLDWSIAQKFMFITTSTVLILMVFYLLLRPLKLLHPVLGYKAPLAKPASGPMNKTNPPPRLTSMKAVTYDRYGPPEVFRLKEIDKPLPGEGEVLIRVKAAEVTKADCELRSFRFPVKWFWLPLRLAFGVFKPRRQVLGGYLAGEIAALGAGVDNFSVGDKVFGSAGLKMGAYAEFVSLPADYTLVPKPDSMSFAEAAAVPLGGLNALHFMNLANIQPGHKILINGAGGSIGLFALQIAKDCGAEVTVVDKTIKKEMLLQHGADKFIDYTQEDFGECPPDYDVVFDMVAQSSYSKCLKVLKPGGHYLIGNPRFSNMLRAVWTSRMSDKTVSFAFARETKEELLTLKALLEEGKIKPPIDTIYRMEQAAEAHYRVEAEERIGMVVLSMDSRSNEGQ